MNQQQMKYARERLTSAYRIKKGEILEFYEKKNEILNDKEKVDALLNGRFSISDTPVKNISYPKWSDFIQFDDQIIFKDEKNSSLDKLETEYRRAMDELMLGDNEQALAAIQAFVKTEYV